MSTGIQVHKPIVNVAMLGARMHYAVPLLLDKAGQLGTFYTDIYLDNKPGLRTLLAHLHSVSKHSLVLRLQGRACDGLPPDKVVSFDGLGLCTYWFRRGARTTAELNRVYALTGQAFCERVVRRGLNGADATYGFNGAALEIFRKARAQATACILEQTSAPKRVERKFLQEEKERWPGCEPGLVLESDDDPLAEREEAEWKLADRIICPSSFVAQGLQSLGFVETAKCQVVPYGIDPRRFQPKSARSPGEKLNVLFVGEVRLRKGVAYLLEALRRLKSNRIHCRLVGAAFLDRKFLSEYRHWIELVGHLPQSRVPELYQWADVFALPSLCEGSATVTYEAIASGLPVVTTANAGSVVRDGQEGFIVPIRDVETLATRLEELSANPELLATMSHAALERSREFTLEGYGERLVKAVQSVLAGEAEKEVEWISYS